MKNLIYVLFMMLTTISLLAQVPQSIKYQAVIKNATGTFGSEQCERFYEGVVQDRGNSISDNEGNLIIAGTYSGEGNFDGNILPSLSAYHFFLAKFDKDNGSVLWLKYDMSSDNRLSGSRYYMTVDSHNNLFLGIAFKDSLVIDDVSLYSEHFCFAVFKFNPNGDIIWVKQSTSSLDKSSYIHDMDINTNNELAIIVQYDEQMEFNGENHSHTGYYNEFAVICMNEEGNTTFNISGSCGTSNTPSLGLCIDYNDYMFVYAEPNNAERLLGDINLSFDADNHAYMVIFDNNHNISDYMLLTVSNCLIQDIITSSSGDIYLDIMHYTNTKIYGTLYNHERGFVLKLDNNGGFKHLIKIEGDISLYCTGTLNTNIIIDNNDNLYWSSYGANDYLYSYGGSSVTADNVIIKINSNNNLEWMKNIESDYYSFSYLTDNFNNTNTIMFSGNHFTIPIVSTNVVWAGDNINDNCYLGLLRADSNGNEIEFGYQCTSNVLEQEPDNNFNIYPNPTTGKITIEGNGIKKIEIIDITGKTIYQVNIVKHEELKQSIELCNQLKGVYLIKIITDKEIVIKKIVVE